MPKENEELKIQDSEQKTKYFMENLNLHPSAESRAPKLKFLHLLHIDQAGYLQNMCPSKIKGDFFPLGQPSSEGLN